MLGVQPAPSSPQAHRKRWGGEAPPPFPVAFGAGYGRLDPPKSAIAGSGGQVLCIDFPDVSFVWVCFPEVTPLLSQCF